jgi:hypothetical protein
MKKQIISEEFLRMQKLAGLITESEFKRQVIKEMKMFDLKDKNGRSTELFKIEDFTTTEDAIKVLNKHFGLSGEDDDTIYTDETGTDYNYVYVANDGSARFVKSLDEFSDGYQTEEEWRVASEEEIMNESNLNENEDEDFDDEDFDLNQAFKDAPNEASYKDVLDIMESYEMDDVLEDFKAEFPKGEPISKDDYSEFAMTLIDDMSEVAFIQANWISIFDEDIYEKAGLV